MCQARAMPVLAAVVRRGVKVWNRPKVRPHARQMPWGAQPFVLCHEVRAPQQEASQVPAMGEPVARQHPPEAAGPQAQRRAARSTRRRPK